MDNQTNEIPTEVIAKEQTLSERLKFWRADRPDEWIMDEFIRAAEKLEKATAPKWSDDPPEVPGWYARDNKGIVCHLFRVEGDLSLRCSVSGRNPSEFTGTWFGPIQQPEGD